jgi:two-component system cell cycle response regulator DivK
MRTVLLIEDNPENMKVASKMLEVTGKYEIIKAQNAEAGIAIADSKQPDIILMDIQLPQMNGLEAVHILKEDENTEHIKIVAFTAYAMDGDEDKIISSGCDGYIAKPIVYKDFIAKIESYLD